MTEYLTTRELADLLRIKERKVYDLAASESVPCTKAHGKLLFPRQAVLAWLENNSQGLDWPGNRRAPDVVLGSHDPLLDWALRESRCGLATFFDGSEDGLNRLVNQEGIACGLHLPEADGWNRNTVAERCGALPVVLVQWAQRARGLLLNPDVAGRVRGLIDLAGLRVVPRQAQAGAQQLFLKLLSETSLSTGSIRFTDPARSESDAATMVAEGKADAAFGLQCFADQLNLAFVPVLTERFDLLVYRHAWFEPPLQTLMQFCRSDRFQRRAAEISGYDVREMGKVHYNAGSAR